MSTMLASSWPTKSIHGYRLVFNLPGADGAEVCKRVWDHPNSMGALVHGFFEIERKWEKCEVPLAQS